MSTAIFIPPYISGEREMKTLEKLNPKQIVKIANFILLLSILGTLISTIIAYAELFSMTIQIIAHIAIMVLVGTLKLGYILRLNGIHLDKQGHGVTR